MPQFGQKQRNTIETLTIKFKVAFVEYRFRFKQALKNTAYWTSVITCGLLISGSILHFGFGVDIAPVAYADTSEFFLKVFGNILYLIFSVLLLAAVVTAYILEIVLLYPYGDPTFFPAWEGNGFVNVDQVVIGWKLVRDICNIFFSIILVIIALGSVLKVEAYSWKQLLPKFFIAAILINFSKSIAGIFTDLATVIMATFGSSFSGSFSRGLAGAFGLGGLGDIIFDTQENDPTADSARSGIPQVLFAYVAAAAMSGVFFILMLVFAATLLFRIIMLWFLIVLSPLAYITRILPVTQRYSSQWWEMFGRYVLVGPLVTFFLWLSLTMALGGGNPVVQGIEGATSNASAAANITQAPIVGSFTSTNPNVIANFLIATMMLMGSLKLVSQMAQEFGSVIGMIESKAGGVALRFAEKVGQIGVQRTSKWGQEEEKDEAGNIIKKADFAHYAGKTLSVLSGTIAQPISFMKNLSENISKSSQGKQDASQNTAMRVIASLRKQQVAGRADTGGKIIGSLANIAGVFAGAGMKDGKVVFDNYLSGAGLLRGANLAFTTSSSLKKADDAHKENKDVQKQLNEEKGKLTEDEALSEAEAYEHLRPKVEALKNTVDSIEQLKGVIHDQSGDLNTGRLNAVLGDLDTKNPTIRLFLQGHIDELQNEKNRLESIGKTQEASAIGAQMAALNKIVVKKGVIKGGDFLEKYAGLASVPNGIKSPQHRKNIQQRIFEQLKSQFEGNYREAERQREEIENGLKNTGYGFDAKKHIVSAGTNFRDDDKVQKLKERSFDLQKFRERLLTELAANAGDDGYETMLAEQEEYSKALQSLSQVFAPKQLIERFAQAKGSGDLIGMRAAWDRLIQTGNLNDLIQDHLSVNKDGTFNEKAGTSAQSMWSGIKDMFGGLADDRTMREIYLKTGIDSFNNGEYDRALGAGYLGGRVVLNSEEARRNLVIMQASKQGPRELSRKGRFAFHSEDGRGNPVFFNKDGLGPDIGVTLLRRMGDELANPNVFPNIQPFVHLGLTQNPNTLRQLLEAGVSQEFIGLVHQWNRTVGASLTDPALTGIGSKQLRAKRARA